MKIFGVNASDHVHGFRHVAALAEREELVTVPEANAAHHDQSAPMVKPKRDEKRASEHLELSNGKRRHGSRGGPVVVELDGEDVRIDNGGVVTLGCGAGHFHSSVAILLCRS